jgi:hypothetical protein
MWLCTRSLLNFLIQNFLFFFNSVWHVDIMLAMCIAFTWNTNAGAHSIFFLLKFFNLIFPWYQTHQLTCIHRSIYAYIQGRNSDAVKSVVWGVSICMFGVRFHAFWLTHVGMKTMPRGGVGTQRNRGACRRGRLTLHFLTSLANFKGTVAWDDFLPFQPLGYENKVRVRWKT